MQYFKHYHCLSYNIFYIIWSLVTFCVLLHYSLEFDQVVTSNHKLTLYYLKSKHSPETLICIKYYCLDENNTMKRQITIPRQRSLISPEISNPFVHKIHLNFVQKLQVCKKPFISCFSLSSSCLLVIHLSSFTSCYVIRTSWHLMILTDVQRLFSFSV